MYPGGLKATITRTTRNKKLVYIDQLVSEVTALNQRRKLCLINAIFYKVARSKEQKKQIMFGIGHGRGICTKKCCVFTVLLL